MKKVISAGIGGRSFTINEDAYERLAAYLNLFREHVKENGTEEVMDELESRIADLFYESVGDSTRVVDLELVEKIISQLGMPDGSSTYTSSVNYDPKANRKLYRDTDDVRIAGVCSGLAIYFGVDIALIRIIMLVALIMGSAGFWIYVILWIAVPKAVTAAQKCELRGLPPTAENLAKFTSNTYKK
ncbi:MAG: PspC domain-containing protein [Bacteroidales bacterium]|jgi:phage shock protein PspC (stress-responsive transcriptional regulator)|nr:PspC domain-containing protein [Bacteroidales bacterium]